MVDFHVILWMNLLHDCFALIKCRTRIVKFNFLNESVVEWKGENSFPRGRIISCLKVCKIISKVCLYHIVRIKYFDSDNPLIEMVPVVTKFPKVLSNDLRGTPPKWEIIFGIDFIPHTNLI